MANKFEGVTDDSITKPNGKRKQIQRICRWCVIFGGSLGAIAIMCAILFGMVNKSHMRNVAYVLSGIGFLVFFLGAFIRLMSMRKDSKQE
ncbi:MAG TPA: hypothetical protein VMW23_04955 [Sedimentisphaerales bacterium]|nr:hypothetical protein [Sedimentisphaerales bacterium]